MPTMGPMTNTAPRYVILHDASYRPSPWHVLEHGADPDPVYALAGKFTSRTNAATFIANATAADDSAPAEIEQPEVTTPLERFEALEQRADALQDELSRQADALQKLSSDLADAVAAATNATLRVDNLERTTRNAARDYADALAFVDE